MKMLSVLILGVLLLTAVSGCSSLGKTKCSDEGDVVGPVATFLSSPAALDCDNKVAMIADLEGFLGSLHLCEASPPQVGVSHLGGPLGSMICPPLIAWGASQLVNNSNTLKRWGCKGSGVTAAFQQACQFIPI